MALMVAAIGIVFMGIAALSQFIQRGDLVSRERMRVQENLLQLTYLLRSQIAQAVDLRLAAGNFIPSNYNLTAPNTGQMVQYRRPAGNFGQVDTLGVFFREAGAPGTSDLRPTGMFFQRPTPTTTGVFYIDTLSASPAPDFDDNFFDKMVEFEADNPQVGGTPARLRSMDFRIVMRFFGDPDTTRWRWCPKADIDAGVFDCRPQVPYHDLEQVVRVSFRNNVINDTSPFTGTPERVFGQLYFYNIYVPF